MAVARAHLLVSGRVQGVFYRASAVEKANALGLAGWVRNLPDGRVEAGAAGPGAVVAALVLWCRQGPGGARVDRGDVTGGEATGEFEGFETRR